MKTRIRAFLSELRRRNVYRATTIYVIVGLGGLGAAELILSPLGFEALMRPIVLLTLAGFPVVVIFSWIYDLKKPPDVANVETTSTHADNPSGNEGSHFPSGRADETSGRLYASSFAEQRIKFCQTTDGVRIAYSTIGSGPPLVRVLGWFTHLEMEWQWPELRFFWENLAKHFTVIRYDGRGTGLSDPWEEEFTEDARVFDLDAVVTASGYETVSLLAISEGGWTAALYSNQRPARVERLVFYGCYSRGLCARPNFDPKENEALMTLIRKGWGRSEPTLRRLFTNDFFPVNANPKLLAHFDELQRVSANADTAVRYVASLHERRGDGRQIFESVNRPSLVLHRQGDRTVPLEEGRRLAALIPGANLQVLRGNDHYFPVDNDSASEIVERITPFVLNNAADKPDV